jgi:hypothetical protein
MPPRAPRLAALLLLTALATRAEAKESAEERATIIFYVDGSASSAGRYTTALSAARAQLVDMNVRLEVERGTDVADVRERMDRIAIAPRKGERTLAAVWLDLRQPGDILVFIADGGARRVLVRRVRLAAGAEGAAFEEMAVIVRSTVGALMEGRAIGMEGAAPTAAPAGTTPKPAANASTSPPPLATPAEEATPGARGDAVPVPAPASALPDSVSTSNAARPVGPAVEARTSPPATGGERALRNTAPPPHPHVEALRLGVAYVGGSLAAGAGWQNGATLSVGYAAPFGAYGSLSYDVYPTASLVASGVELELARHPATLAVGYERLLFATRVRLAGELGVMADAIQRSAVAAAGFVPTPDATHLVWALGPRARVAVHLVAPVWLAVGAGLDVVLTKCDYVVSPAVPVLDLDAIRPRLELGLVGALF